MPIGKFLIIAAFTLTLVGTAHAVPFQNGSFENRSPQETGTLDAGDATAATSMPGWRVFTGDIDYMPNLGVVPFFGWSSAHGDWSLDLNGRFGPGGIEQTFDTIPGTTYTVTFSMAGNPELLPAVKTLQVVADGSTPNAYAFDSTGKDIVNMGWIDQSYSFAASSTSTTLRFISLTTSINGSFGPALDNVRVAASPVGAVPEPASLLLLGSGLAGLAAWRRRRG